MITSSPTPGLALGAALLSILSTVHADSLVPRLPQDRQVWTGPDLWANPMEDWVAGNGRARNTHSGGDRELVVLTGELNDRKAGFEISATFERQKEAKGGGDGFIGFQLGLEGSFNDYRDSAIYGSGLPAGVRADGLAFIGGRVSDQRLTDFTGPVELKLTVAPQEDGRFTLTLAANGAEFTNKDVDGSWLVGLVSITTSSQPANEAIVRRPRPERVPSIRQNRGGGWLFEVSNIRMSGEKFSAHPDRSFGPIYWTQHTLEHDGTLNLIAQLAPVDTEGAEVTLSLDGKAVATSGIDGNSRVAQFRVKGVDTTRDHAYVVRFGGDEFTGTIRKEPMSKNDITVAAMSCNDSTGFPHNLLVGNVTAQKPDLIAFMGDQIYEPIGGYGLLIGAGNTEYDDRTFLCYLRKYAMHGWTWRDLMRDIPCFALPDDHDVFHGNIWGAGGKLADRSQNAGAAAQDSGGYKMSAAFVNAVELTQTGSLPAAVDPAPIQNGIHVYFTDWQYAGVDMAILADRQFKSAPKALLPESRIHNGWPQNHAKQKPALEDPRELDVEGAQLLGERQEAFLEDWSEHRPEDTAWRLVISATPLMTLQSIPEDKFSDGVVPSLKRPLPGEYPPDDIPKLDYDSNGWPQSKRDLAVELITKAHAVHVTGDQHLGSTGQYGVASFNDGAWWISSPAIANLWPRRWFPKDGGANRREGDPRYTGEFEDGFGNRITLHAVANPYDIDREPSRLYDKAVGYSMLTLDRSTGNITLANWPYYASPERPAPDDKPYEGWPITIDPKTNRRVD